VTGGGADQKDAAILSLYVERLSHPFIGVLSLEKDRRWRCLCRSVKDQTGVDDHNELWFVDLMHHYA
jgi:hypothetical protein